MSSDESHGIRRSFIIITTVFFTLAIAVQGLMLLYWNSVLQPRLKLEADSQAKVLAQSQAGMLSNTITSAAGDERVQKLMSAINQTLLLSDPDTDIPFFMGIGLEIDYDTVDAPAGSLDVKVGQPSCLECFYVDVALYSSSTDELLGIAWFMVSDRFFKLLSHDMKNQLLSETAITLLLMAIVWLLVMELFRRLHQAKQRIETASKARSRFLANISHEIRTPLNAILGYAQLLQRDSYIMDSHNRAIDTIYNSGEHLLLMINDILDLSKIEADKLELSLNDFRLPEFLFTLTEMMQLRAKMKNISFTQSNSPDLATTIHGDEKRLRQVLLNLLSNAVKFTPEGSVHFEVTNQSTRKIDGKTMQKLRFLVKDTGIGIPKERQGEIFVAFQQIINPEIETEGTGLGLTISQRLINLMGSQLQMSSEQNKGSCFWFELDFPVVESAPLESVTPKSTILGYAGPKRKLLIVDDKALNRQLLSGMLTPIGFSIEEAQNAEETLEKLKNNDFDLILLDLLMPNTDGFTIAALIRQNMTYKHKPIIAVSAATDRTTLKKARLSGFQDFLSKPVDIEALYNCLQKYLHIEWLEEDNQSLPTLSSETPPIPPKLEQLKSLLTYTQKHNILELRQACAKLKQQQEFSEFAHKLEPMINNYQFKLIAEWLEVFIAREGNNNDPEK